MDSPVRIIDIAPDQRPRERLAAVGTRALSDAELLAIQLGSGSRGRSALTLAHQLLSRWGGAAGLAGAEVSELARTVGVGPAKAARVVSAFALGGRAAETSVRVRLSGSADIADVAIPIIGRARQEQVLVVVADGQSRVCHSEIVAQGSAKHCPMPVREVLAMVLRHDGVAFAVAHNHPGGDPAPSSADVEVTARLRDAATEVGLRFLDHVVVAGGDWRSITASR